MDIISGTSQTMINKVIMDIISGIPKQNNRIKAG